MELTEKQLHIVAEEMNRVMDLNPPIDLELEFQELVTEIKDSIEMINERDKFTHETKDVISGLKGSGKTVEITEEMASIKLKKENIKDVKDVKGVKDVKEKKGVPAEKKTEGSKLKVEKKQTRPQVFAEILLETIDNPMTIEEMVELMKKRHYGSTREAEYWVRIPLRYLVALGLIEVTNGKVSYNVK